MFLAPVRMKKKIKNYFFHPQYTRFLNSPDFPSTRYSLMDLVCTHCNCTTFNRFCIVIYCHCLSDSELGNLRTCCLPWKYSPFLRRILRNQTLIPRIRRFLVRSLPWQQDDKSEIWMKRRRASLRPRSDTVIVNHQAFVFEAPAEPASLLFGMPDRLCWFCKSNKYRPTPRSAGLFSMY